jgi:transposase-like protein
MKRYGFCPRLIVTDKLRSYDAALREIGFCGRHDQGQRANNRAENSHPAFAATGAEDATLQIAQIRPALRSPPRRRLQ